MSKTASGLPASLLRPPAATVGGDEAVDPSGSIVTLTHAERLLAQVATAEEAATVVRFAEAARVYAQQAALGAASVNYATTIKVLAERRMAECVDKGQAAGEIATPGGDRTIVRSPNNGATLADLGISAPRLNEARLLRDEFTEEEVRERAAAASEKDKVLARDRLLREARDRKAEEARDEEARHKAEILTLPPAVDIRGGDFREVLADLERGSVNAIITDPPYPAEFLPLFRDLAEFANQVLADDGVLAVMSGQTHLPAVFELMAGFRPYRWTIAYLTPGSGYASHARKVQSNWKPVLVFGGSRRFGDVVTSDAESKHLHEWGQNVAAFGELVDRLSAPGDLVCDPFLGAGSTALAAIAQGRRFVGADLDPEAVASATRRLAS